MDILIVLLVLTVIWSLLGVVSLTTQVRQQENSSYALTREQWLWVLERDSRICQFSQWDIPSKSYLICGETGAHVILVGSFPIRPSNYICICEKHAKWVSASKQRSLEMHLIASAEGRGKELSKTKKYPLE